MRFKELLEARAAEQDKLFFNQNDLDYAKSFVNPNFSEKINTLFLAQALQYRFGPKVLQEPHPEVRTITLTTTDFENSRKYSHTFHNVNTHSLDLIARIKEKGEDPDDFMLSRMVTNRLAPETLQYIQGRSSKVPYIAPKVINKLMNRGNNHMQTALTRESFPLDDNDKEFLAWFDRNGLTRHKIKAFADRYSSKYVNSPQANARDAQGNVGKFFSLQFGGKTYSFIPVNASELKQRLDMFKEKGIDYYTKPLSISSATRWIDQGFITPGHKAKVNHDIFAKDVF